MGKDTLQESIRAEKAMNEALKEAKSKNIKIDAKGVTSKVKVVAKNI